jgi:signal transduction histidine kinase
MRSRYSLQRALLGTIALALLLGLVPGGIALDRRLVTALLAKARSDLEMAPRILADRDAARADMLRMQAQDFARVQGLSGALMRGDTSTINRLAERAEPALGGSPLVVAREGTVLSGPPEASSWSSDARRGVPSVATTVHEGAVYHIALVPVEVDGRLTGAAGLAHPMNEQLVEALAGLTRSDVTILVGPRDSVSVSTLDKDAAAALSLATAGVRAPSAREYSINGGVMIALTAPLGGGARVVFSRSRSAELAVIPALRRIAAVSAVVALAFALALGALFAALIAKPVRELSAAAEAMRRGAFDAPLPRSRIVEVERVASQFADMRGTLERQMAELRSANDALEERNVRLIALQADLMQRDRLAATGQLVANLAHEIRNPIANLRNLLELVRRGARDAQSREYSDLAIDELLRMHELAERLLDLNRPVDPSSAVSQPLKIASDVARLTTAGVQAGEMQVTVSGTDTSAAAIAPDALKQVLLNLVQNAREAVFQAGRRPARILLDVRRTGEEVVIAVEDNGPGVPRELRTRIFDPFFTTKGAVDGVGLGLFVAEGLVRTAGGRLSLESAPGGGARFVVELPTVRAEADPASGPASTGAIV